MTVLNLIIFPDWQQPEATLYSDLEKLIRVLLTHPDKDYLTLFIDSQNLDKNPDLDANLILSTIVLNLLLEEEINTNSEPEIILLDPVPNPQENLQLNSLNYRIILTHENLQAAGDFAKTLPTIELNCLNSSSLQLAASTLLELADQRFKMGNYPVAISYYQRVLEQQTGEAELYFNLSECFWKIGQEKDAIAVLKDGTRLHPHTGKLHFYLIKYLQQTGQVESAIEQAEIASNLLPNEYIFKLLKHLTLPIIYKTVDEIEVYKQRFLQELDRLTQETVLDTSEARLNALFGTSSFTNFYLAYQAYNVVEPQAKYANLIHRIMAANYPQWVQPRTMPAIPETGKIRVGYASNYLHSYSGTLWLTGWLRYANKKRLEIYCYYTGNEPDLITQQFKEFSDYFYHIPHNLEANCQQIIQDDLHILVYPEIGMDAPTIQMAGLRLAPIQCSAWGHPVTSGLPTIDYFISSELMEPVQAQEHYSETLIRLPNIGVSYPKPLVGTLTHTRSDYDLSDEAILYLCCQAPFKYLPQYDYILPAIAGRVPQAKFIFPRGELLRERLKQAFVAVDLHSEDYCLFMPLATRQDYIAINFLSDVFLDTFTWSGGNTTLEAIACNLPVVTCPGEFMRGLHAYSFLKMLGVTDTIAQNEAEYIEIAVKLGLDTNWRQDISQRLSQRHELLFDDRVCVTALEAFYQKAVRDQQLNSPES